MKRLATLFALTFLPAIAAEPAARPNIVFILCDDLAQGDLGVYGQKLIQTPRLDRLASEGTRYLQAYCGASVCAPSRTSLMTGLHSGNSPVRGNWEMPVEGQLPLPADTLTVAEVLRGAGYATAVIGKWGMGMFDTTGSPLKQGFDHFFGANCQRQANSHYPPHIYSDDRRIELPGNTGKGVGKYYIQDLVQEDVLRWVRASADNPFFLFYALTLPHLPNDTPTLEPYAGRPWTRKQKAYAAEVTRVDHDIGQLLDLLTELKIDKNTLVIVSGDNGASFPPDSELGRLFEQSANGLRGYKRELYEGALRQPAIARWPGVVPPGRVSDEPWAFWDFLPTAAELAGAKLPEDYRSDGYSLVGFLRGGPAPQRDFFYWELHETTPIQAVRFGSWKAVKKGPSEAIELYDLVIDAGETTNLAAAHPDSVRRAAQLMATAHMPDPHWPLMGRASNRPK